MEIEIHEMVAYGKSLITRIYSVFVIILLEMKYNFVRGEDKSNRVGMPYALS